jgi:hypothetical protein
MTLARTHAHGRAQSYYHHECWETLLQEVEGIKERMRQKVPDCAQADVSVGICLQFMIVCALGGRWGIKRSKMRCREASRMSLKTQPRNSTTQRGSPTGSTAWGEG